MTEQIGNNAAERLRSFIERVERLEEEKAALAADIREVYAEAKGAGYGMGFIEMTSEASAQQDVRLCGASGTRRNPRHVQTSLGDITEMTPKQIRNKALKLKIKMNDLHTQTVALQCDCPHRDVIKKANSDTGNWCRGDDCYWYECSCPDCGKQWHEDQ